MKIRGRYSATGTAVLAIAVHGAVSGAVTGSALAVILVAIGVLLGAALLYAIAADEFGQDDDVAEPRVYQARQVVITDKDHPMIGESSTLPGGDVRAMVDGVEVDIAELHDDVAEPKEGQR